MAWKKVSLPRKLRCDFCGEISTKLKEIKDNYLLCPDCLEDTAQQQEADRLQDYQEMTNPKKPDDSIDYGL